LAANKATLFQASYHQKVNNDVEAGARATWNKAVKDAPVAIEVGTKVALDSTAYFKAKVDNEGRLGLGYTQKLRDGVKVSFGTLLSSQNNSVGMQLTFDL
jgi:hypothetical protein